MKYAQLVIALLFTTFATAQNFIDKHYASYQDLDESTVIHVAPKSKRGYSILENGYESLVDIKDKQSRFGFFIDQEDDVIYEIVGLGTDNGGIFVVSITGEMRLDMVAEIINEFQEEGQFSKLSPLKKYDSVVFEAYPNPASNLHILGSTKYCKSSSRDRGAFFYAM